MKPAELGKSGAIDKDAISHAWDVLKKAEPNSERDVAVWMGKHATAKRFGESIALFDEKGFLEQLGANKREIDYDAWEEAGFLQRNEGVRFAFIDSVNDNSMDNDDDDDSGWDFVDDENGRRKSDSVYFSERRRARVHRETVEREGKRGAFIAIDQHRVYIHTKRRG